MDHVVRCSPTNKFTPQKFTGPRFGLTCRSHNICGVIQFRGRSYGEAVGLLPDSNGRGRGSGVLKDGT